MMELRNESKRRRMYRRLALISLVCLCLAFAAYWKLRLGSAQESPAPSNAVAGSEGSDNGTESALPPRLEVGLVRAKANAASTSVVTGASQVPARCHQCRSWMRHSRNHSTSCSHTLRAAILSLRAALCWKFNPAGIGSFALKSAQVRSKRT
jgi:hypothetical protein